MNLYFNVFIALASRLAFVYMFACVRYIRPHTRDEFSNIVWSWLLSAIRIISNLGKLVNLQTPLSTTSRQLWGTVSIRVCLARDKMVRFQESILMNWKTFGILFEAEISEIILAFLLCRKFERVDIFMKIRYSKPENIAYSATYLLIQNLNNFFLAPHKETEASNEHLSQFIFILLHFSFYIFYNSSLSISPYSNRTKYPLIMKITNKKELFLHKLIIFCLMSDNTAYRHW